MISPDASKYGRSQDAAQLIDAATRRVGSRYALSKRVGLGVEQLRLLRNGERRLKYPVQFTLEVIINEP